MVLDPRWTDDRGHLSKVTLLFCLRRVGNSLCDGAPIHPTGPYSNQQQCLPLRTLAAHRKLGWCPGLGAGTPHLLSLPPLLLLIPPSHFITIFELDAFSMSSGSIGRRDPGACWEAFLRQMALGLHLKTVWWWNKSRVARLYVARWWCPLLCDGLEFNLLKSNWSL